MKIGQKLIISLILLTIHIQAFSSDCKEITKREEYKRSEFVFIGQIINVNPKCISIIPLEIFKGRETVLFIALNYSESWQLDPKEHQFMDSELGEVWLFYGENLTNDTLFINPCGWSTNIFDPRVQVLPPPNMDQFKSIDYLVTKITELSAKLELYQDIQVYRYNKKESEQSEENSKPDYSMLFTCIITALLLVLIVLNVNILRRMK